MPSVKQVIAEIQLAADLPPGHIAKAIQIIRDAEERLKIKGATNRPRKASGKNLVTLQEWEDRYGTLSTSMMADWIERQELCSMMIQLRIAEFRGEMIAKGKQYANFKAAFMTYLAKGYLSKSMEACSLAKSSFQAKTTINSRGVNL